MKTLARRFFEFILLSTLFCGSSYLCYDCGRRDPVPATPATVQPTDPPAPVIEEEKPADEKQQAGEEILIRGTPFIVSPKLSAAPKMVFHGAPFFVSKLRFTGPSLPAQDDAPVAIHPKPECGREPENLEPVASTEPLPPAQQQVEYQCNCRRCRRWFRW